MTNPRQLLILLGFVCQGFVWDNYFAWIGYALIWFFCIKFRFEKRMLSPVIEGGIFFMAFFLAVKFGGRNILFKSLGIGNSLTVLQVIWLLQPISRREKRYTIAIALTQLAIGSQVIFGYGFAAILISALLLLPRALYDVEEEETRGGTGSRWVPYGKLAFTVIAILTVMFFLFFPRRQLFDTRGTNLIRSRMMQPQLDTSSGGSQNSDRVIFQIQGDQIDYLKSYTLDSFDGNAWTSSSINRTRARRLKYPDEEKEIKRNVTVKDINAIGNALPTDGYVSFVSGNFFLDPYISRGGAVGVARTFPTSNNTYEYWTSKNEHVDKLNPRQEKRSLEYPQQPQRVDEFLNRVVGNEKNPRQIAKKLEKYLRDNFKYKIGAPDLNRLSPIEDFLYNQKEGHCERFASVLAVLLRMKGIPSRVVLGFYTMEKNQFADLYNVRANHAHAWTEAFIPGQGWITLDATPYGEGTGRYVAQVALSLYDWIEYVWYNKIVNFSVQDQNTLVNFTAKKLKQAGELFTTSPLTLGIILPVFAVIIFLMWKFRNRRWQTKRRKKTRSAQEAEVKHFYGVMLKYLAKKRFRREPAQTPYEFLGKLREQGFSLLEDARFVTESFCAVKYGGCELTEPMRREIQKKLAKIRKK